MMVMQWLVLVNHINSEFKLLTNSRPWSEVKTLAHPNLQCSTHTLYHTCRPCRRGKIFTKSLHGHIYIFFVIDLQNIHQRIQLYCFDIVLIYNSASLSIILAPANSFINKLGHTKCTFILQCSCFRPLTKKIDTGNYKTITTRCLGHSDTIIPNLK